MPRTITLALFAALLCLAILVLTNAVQTSFVRLGVPRGMVTIVMVASLLGSAVNLPLWERSAGLARGRVWRVGGFFYYQPPRVERQLVAINVGGAVIPILISAWLLTRAPFWKIALATVVVAAVAHAAARVVPGRGVQMPLFVAPLASALVASLLTLNAGSGLSAAPIAYVAGSMGTLLGADLLNLRRLDLVGPGVMAIGGAGVFDGVFLVGLVAAFIA